MVLDVDRPSTERQQSLKFLVVNVKYLQSRKHDGLDKGEYEYLTGVSSSDEKVLWLRQVQSQID